MKKRKKEKKLDFVKRKLKVGKAGPGASNATDTRAKTKRIVVPNQARQTGGGAQHALCQTRHYAPAVRRIGLEYLTARPVEAEKMFDKIIPLIIDVSPAVRKQLLELLSQINQKLFAVHIDALALYWASAMTHVMADVRADATRFLSILLDNISLEFLTAHWKRGLDVFFTFFRTDGSHTDNDLVQFLRFLCLGCEGEDHSCRSLQAKFATKPTALMNIAISHPAARQYMMFQMSEIVPITVIMDTAAQYMDTWTRKELFCSSYAEGFMKLIADLFYKLPSAERCIKTINGFCQSS